MYRMENEVPFTRTGADGRLKLHEAVAMMMDCCQFQEYQEVNFCRFLRENHLAIFLFSIQLDILRLPEFREKVSTAVKIYGCKSIYGLRRITMRDAADVFLYSKDEEVARHVLWSAQKDISEAKEYLRYMAAWRA